MKAWVVEDLYNDDGCMSVVFAETRGKAKHLALYTEACYDAKFINIRARRIPVLDKFYTPGKIEMDWSNYKDRIELVKLGWTCLNTSIDECKQCKAKKYCEFLTGGN